METKQFRVDFFTGQVGPDGEAGFISNLLYEMSRNVCPTYNIGNYKYEIRDLETFAEGTSFKGVFAKFRSEDLPHIGAPGGDERDIEIEPEEGLIEKNYFLYYKRFELLVYQSNRHASTANMFGKYITQFTNETSIFNPVLQLEPMRRLLSHNAKPRKIELSFARPNSQWLDSEHIGFSNNLMKFLSNAGGYHMHFTITPPKKGVLNMSVKDWVKSFFEDVEEDVNIARVNIDEDGNEYTIDLVADRLFTFKTVRMNGRYPVPDEMFGALREAWDNNRNTIEEILGE